MEASRSDLRLLVNICFVCVLMDLRGHGVKQVSNELNFKQNCI